MFVGEAPGANEDRQGRPFVGAAGSTSTASSRRSGSSARRCSSRTCSSAGRRVTATPPRGDRGAPRTSCVNRADRAQGHLHPGQLRHGAPHGPPRGIPRVHGVPQDRVVGSVPTPLPDLPPRGGAAHGHHAGGAARGPRASPSCCEARAPAPGGAGAPASEGAKTQLGLFRWAGGWSEGRSAPRRPRRPGRARRLPSSRRRRARVRRAGQRQDHLRPRRVPRARGARPGHEPDLRRRARLRRPPRAARAPRPLPAGRPGRRGPGAARPLLRPDTWPSWSGRSARSRRCSAARVAARDAAHGAGPPAVEVHVILLGLDTATRRARRRAARRRRVVRAARARSGGSPPSTRASCCPRGGGDGRGRRSRGTTSTRIAVGRGRAVHRPADRHRDRAGAGAGALPLVPVSSRRALAALAAEAPARALRSPSSTRRGDVRRGEAVAADQGAGRLAPRPAPPACSPRTSARGQARAGRGRRGGTLP